MVIRSLVRLSGTQPGPAPSMWIPGMRRAERKGHYAYQLLYWANVAGGVIAMAFAGRYMLMKERGLCTHVQRPEYTDKDEGASILQRQVFASWPEQDISKKPLIGVFQPLSEAGKLQNDGDHH